MHVVIFAGGALRPGKAFYAAIDSADMFIAADSGAATALQYGCTPRIVVGDFDSLDELLLEDLGKRGSEIRRAAAEAGEADTDGAVLLPLHHSDRRLTLVRALIGARFDH